MLTIDQEKALRLLNETGRIAKIGGWELDLATKELTWTDETFRILDDIFDVAPGEFSGAYSAWEGRLSPASRAAAVHDLELALKGEKEFNSEFEIMDRSGRIRTIAGRGFVFRNDKNEAVKMYGINWDVTDRVQQENQLKAANVKLIQSAKLASLGEMSASVAHEINNPLAIIKASTFNHHSVTEMIQESAQLLEVKLKNSGIQFDLHCQSSSKIFCNEVEIQQVFVILISNSIDAVKTLPEKWIKVECFDQHNEIVIEVNNSGSGIPESLRAKIFEPFFTTKIFGEGTGLGLSITKGILDEHKAKLSVLSDRPRTCFQVRFLKV